MFKLKQLSTKHQTATSTPSLYDPFLFIDSLTNRSIPVKDIKSVTTSKSKIKTNANEKRFSEDRQIDELDDCIDFLKSTITFRKNALREKLFGQFFQKKQIESKKQQIFRKKQLIRKMLQKKILEKSRQELTEYLNNPAYRPPEILVKISQTKSFQINKTFITKLLQSLECKDNNFESKSEKKQLKFDKSPFLNKMNLLQTEINNDVKQRLRKSGGYLIEPENNFIPLKAIKKGKTVQEYSEKSSQMDEAIKKLNWKTNQSNMAAVKRKKRGVLKSRGQNKRSQEIIHIITNCEVEDLEIYVSKNKINILNTRDEDGNTLLHLAAANRKPLIFQWLLRNLGVTYLLIKNDKGMTPVDIAHQLRYRQILSYVPQSLI